jgi:hypothetical protein
MDDRDWRDLVHNQARKVGHMQALVDLALRRLALHPPQIDRAVALLQMAKAVAEGNMAPAGQPQ